MKGGPTTFIIVFGQIFLGYITISSDVNKKLFKHSDL